MFVLIYCVDCGDHYERNVFCCSKYKNKLEEKKARLIAITTKNVKENEEKHQRWLDDVKKYNLRVREIVYRNKRKLKNPNRVDGLWVKEVCVSGGFEMPLNNTYAPSGCGDVYPWKSKVDKKTVELLDEEKDDIINSHLKCNLRNINERFKVNLDLPEYPEVPEYKPYVDYNEHNLVIEEVDEL